MIPPSRSGTLNVGHGHRLHWSRHGNPSGEPWIFIHGGPGGRSSEHHLAFFDLDRHDVVLYDQRGCGRSTPYGQWRWNTTGHLVGDIRQIALAAGMAQPNLLGVSWGAWLALIYRALHVQACARVVLACPAFPLDEVLAQRERALRRAIASIPGSGQSRATGSAPPITAIRRFLLVGSHGQRQWAARVMALADTAPGLAIPDTFNEASMAALAIEATYADRRFYLHRRTWECIEQLDGSGIALVAGSDDGEAILSMGLPALKRAAAPLIVPGVGHHAFHSAMLVAIRERVANHGKEP